MNRYLTFFLLVLLLSGCTSRKEQLTKVWFFITEEHEEDAGESVKDAGELNMTPATFINLKEDGTYTSYFGSFGLGKWSLEGDDLQLSDSKGRLAKLHIRKLEDNVLLFINENNGTTYEFEGFANSTAAADDPFSPENNRWRVRAERKESDAELTARLKNHFRYWEKYFSWGLEHRKGSLDVRSLPGPLKIYGNGFTLVPYEHYDYEWKMHFFDADDCYRAYLKMYSFLRKEDIEWPQTDHKFKQFQSAFRQLQQKLN